VENSHHHLKNGKYFAVNIAGDDLKAELLRLAEPLFGKPEKILNMRLSKIIGNRKKDKSKFKLEPIFLFRK